MEWFRERFFGWLLIGWEWNRILWFRFKCRCWCAVGHICGICIAGRRLEDFVPLPLIHRIACSNVDVVICSYITFIEYDIALDSDGSFLRPVYLIALRLQIVAYESSNLGACI